MHSAVEVVKGANGVQAQGATPGRLRVNVIKMGEAGLYLGSPRAKDSAVMTAGLPTGREVIRTKNKATRFSMQIPVAVIITLAPYLEGKGVDQVPRARCDCFSVRNVSGFFLLRHKTSANLKRS